MLNAMLRQSSREVGYRTLYSIGAIKTAGGSEQKYSKPYLFDAFVSAHCGPHRPTVGGVKKRAPSDRSIRLIWPVWLEMG